MKFEEYQYDRPEMVDFSSRFESLLKQFKEAPDLATQNQLFSQINEMRTEFMSMYNICYIRHTVDTANEFYEKENAFLTNRCLPMRA